MPPYSRCFAIAIAMMSLAFGSKLHSQVHSDAVKDHPAQTGDMDWGQPRIKVNRAGDSWTISGGKNTLTLGATDLAISITSDGVTWNMEPSEIDDLVVQLPGSDEFNLKLTQAGRTIIQGDFVSLKEKIARNPTVEKLIGSLVAHLWSLNHQEPGSMAYNKEDPSKNHYYIKFDAEAELEMARVVCALHRRVALLEMRNHEFMDKNYRKQKTTFADGTTVTIDPDAETFEIAPKLQYRTTIL